MAIGNIITNLIGKFNLFKASVKDDKLKIISVLAQKNNTKLCH